MCVSHWTLEAVATATLVIGIGKVKVIVYYPCEMGTYCWLLIKEKVVAQEALKAKLAPWIEGIFPFDLMWWVDS